MKNPLVVIFVAVSIHLLSGAVVSASNRLNHLQVLTTIGSNHISPPPEVFEYLQTTPATGKLNTKSAAYKIAFSELTLTQQLDKGYRGFEFNVHADYAGGAYQYSALYKLAGLDGDLSKKYPELMLPGFKSFKSTDIDPESTCILFADCLTEIVVWSNKHPGHLPITIVIHPGDDKNLAAAFNLDADDCYGCFPYPGYMGPCNCTCDDCSLATFYNENILAKLLTGPAPNMTTTPNPVLYEGDLAALEDTIQEVVPKKKLLTPSMLLASTPGAKTLKQAVFPPTGKWPSIKKLLGKIIFVVDPGFLPFYLNLHQPNNLQSAVMFASQDADDLAALVASDPGEAIVFLDILGDNLQDKTAKKIDPFPLIAGAKDSVDATASLVKTAVSQGYIVRSQLDKNFAEVFYNYTYRAEQFVKAGCQYAATLVTTSPPFPTSYSALPSDYFGANIVGRCNPTTTFGSSASSTGISFVDGYCQGATSNPDGELCSKPVKCQHIDGYTY